MATAVDIVLEDAASPAVSHTFIPLGRDSNNWFWFEDQSAANAIGNWRISVKLERPPVAVANQSSEGRNFRVKVQLHEPTLANVTNSTVSGVQPAPMLAYTTRGTAEYIIPERGTLQNRLDISKMFPALLQNSQIQEVVNHLTYLN